MSKSIPIHESCPMEISINILSGKWTLKILWILSKAESSLRFNELRRRVGDITIKALADALKELEHKKIIERKVYPEVPPRVEYYLTEVGHTLDPVLKSLCEWGKFYKDRV